jgi:hypothetical protein
MGHFVRIAMALGIAVATALLSTPGVAASTSDRVTGSLLVTGSGNTFLKVTFTCFGWPTCSGIFTALAHDGPVPARGQPGCANDFTYSDAITITGLDLSHAGSFQGLFALARGYTSAPNAGSVCTYTVVDQPINISFTGNWDGATGTMDFSGTVNGDFLQIHGSFAASISAASPVFPMTVTGNITPATANVSAQIQPRPQDVGTQGSIFVFAHAPSSLLKSADDKRAAPGVPALTADEPVVCVLAQVNGQGQLVAVSAASMQAYLTGVLSSQAQAVAILNSIATPNVAGATFFIGYGPNAGTMIATGIYQTAVTIPGGVQCSASLASAPAPATPGALTGLWWNAAESGWGIHFTQRASNVFAAWYTYDGAGKAKWYVSTCTGAGGASGICNGTLYEVVGPSFFGGSFNPALVSAANAGTLQVNFRDVNNATFTYTLAGQTRSIPLVRQPLATGTTPPAVDYTDLWWSPSESGWGMAMAQQYGVNFLAWYVYDSNGKPTWQVATCTMSGSSCAGTLYRTTGPAFGPTFNPAQVQATTAGTILVIFTDANNAILSYTVDGVTATKSVTRQLF